MSTNVEEVSLPKKTVLLFRAPKEGETDLFEKELLKHSYKPFSIPVLEFNYINIDKLSECLSQYRDYSAVVFTSQRAVEAAVLSGKRTTGAGEETSYSDLTCYVVGGSTGKAAKEAGFCLENCDAGNAEKLADYIIQEAKSRQKPILYPCGNIRKDTLSKKLKETGFSLTEIEVYETVKNKSIKTKVEELLQQQGLPDYMVYFSPSGVQYTEDIISSGLLPVNQVKVVAIGPTTEKELRGQGIPVYGVASTPNPEGLLQALS
ncbi:uroporphyrinogen-III synthase-like [Mercenaria mercenaria]|uniref:uroporphyrinogen-III synthase-like n=1 Tax=Mercenaria mercenaria TaxID=6596 RepID=UPI00234F50C8|nr:uroporphyrinogen-III synthase-like [Mercenaria mercenaria]XP_053407667.1 uroporphyrinogen-III synthase-like [Mercenaria mercenaria]